MVQGQWLTDQMLAHYINKNHPTSDSFLVDALMLHHDFSYVPNLQWFQSEMMKITQQLSQLPVKGTKVAVHVMQSKLFSEQNKIYQYEEQKVVLILICFYLLNFCFKVKYMYRKLMAFLREVIFQSLIRMILTQKIVINFIPDT